MGEKIIKVLNKKFEKPITCLTAYSSSVAKMLDGNVDMILIGDSLGSTLYGMNNTRGVTIEMMKNHGRAVTKNVFKSITILDMPYKTYSNKKQALKNAKSLIKYTKAKFLKLEINKNNLSILKYLSDKNIDTIAHIGVTPQSFSNFNKIKTVGKSKNEMEKLIDLAIRAEKAGAKSLLLECVSLKAAKKITSLVTIPTIGIGSSKFCDGQVLVFDDLINLTNNQHLPKFVKKYFDFSKLGIRAIRNYNSDVKLRKFPSKKYSYQ